MSTRLTHRTSRGATILAVVGILTGIAVGCTPTSPAPTLLAISTELTVCGGVIPPPGEPWCHTNPTSGAVAVTQGRTVVATGTTGADGMVTLSVPSGTLVVSRTDAQTYLDCDKPSVHIDEGTTLRVVQECILNAP